MPYQPLLNWCFLGPAAPVGGRVGVPVQIGDAAVAVEQRHAAPGGAFWVVVHGIHAQGDHGVLGQVRLDNAVEHLLFILVMIEKRLALLVSGDEAAAHPAVFGQRAAQVPLAPVAVPAVG